MKARSILWGARRRAGFSQRELARRAGVPQSTVSRIERGLIVPGVELLERLLRACGMDLVAVEHPARGVDVSLVRERLPMTPDERVKRTVAEWEATAPFRKARERR